MRKPMKLHTTKEWFHSRAHLEEGQSIEVRPAKETPSSGSERRLVRGSDGDPHDDPEYQAHIEKLAAECGYDDGPCDGCLAGGLCDCDIIDAHPLYDDDFSDTTNADVLHLPNHQKTPI